MPDQNGPLASQRSICARRSLPQNGSPSTMKKGAPNTPCPIASSQAWRRRAFQAGAVHTASASAASTPNSAASRFNASASARLTLRVKYARRQWRAQGAAEAGRASLSHQNKRAAFCVAIGKGSGNLNGTPAKRADRSKSCNEYSRLIGWLTGLFSSAAWKVTPSRIAFQFTMRPCRAAKASIHSEAMYVYGDEKSK